MNVVDETNQVPIEGSYDVIVVGGGIAEELLHLSIQYGYDNLAPQWKDGSGEGADTRYTTIFSPPEFIYALDELMMAEGVDLLFDTALCMG